VHLLKKLQESNEDPLWNDHQDLLIWILHIGGSFSPKGATRLEYKAILQTHRVSGFREKYSSLEELIQILDQFVWSGKAYRAQLEDFWNEIEIA
jgi:hypothetical protein